MRSQDSVAPTPIPSRSNSEPPNSSNHSPEDLGRFDRLTSQIRAFLAASEDVDIDMETVEDLMNAFPDSVKAAEQGEPSVDHEDVNGKAPSEVEIMLDEDDMELDVSALFTSRDQALQSWSAQEVRAMMRYLKEHGMSAWVGEYVTLRKHSIPKLLAAFGIDLCPELRVMPERTMMYFLKVAMSRELRLREKLPQYNTVADAVQLIQSSRRIILLTGAGISVSCGIPDFRSRNGLYASLKENGDYDLDDPQQMCMISSLFWESNSEVSLGSTFITSARIHQSVNNFASRTTHADCSSFTCRSSFASQIYPSNFVPSPCHRFIKVVEDNGQLLRNYTQNIDTLETLAGVKNVLQCHGSFATATCIQCRTTVEGSAIEADIMKRRVPLCRLCNCSPPADPQSKSQKPGKSKSRSKKKRRGQWDSEEEDGSDSPQYPAGIMKPDITFFGEKLSSNFDHCLAADRSQVDLLLVIGTSLKVAPVSDILYHLPHSVPQILINKTPIRHINPDIVLLGDADVVVSHLCHKLGWDLSQTPSLPRTPPSRTESTSVVQADVGNSTPPSTMRFQPPRGNVNMKKRSQPDLPVDEEPKRVFDSHVWLFRGAEGGKWLQDFEQAHMPAASSHAPVPPQVPPPAERDNKKQRTR
ncbi:hypothetical protein ONZ45_g2882 [Pleurotus djamor]|nr:hypothetical protein ONZ45_g2882 [Pleurotus djamor]